jgi:hypothetical protein
MLGRRFDMGRVVERVEQPEDRHGRLSVRSHNLR